MKNHLSEEVLDILNESPRWLVRMGASMMFFLVLLILGGAAFIRYPEVLRGDVVVTTAQPPIKIVAQREGRVARLLIPTGSDVRKGQVLAELENRTQLEDLPTVQDLLTQTRLFLDDPRRDIRLPQDSLTWGDLQADVLQLSQNYADFKHLQTAGSPKQQAGNLKIQVAAMRQLQQVLSRKKRLKEAEFANAADNYQTDQKLFAEGIYSRTEFLKKENAYLEKKSELESLEENLIKNDLRRTEIEQELQVLEYSFSEKQRLYLNNIRQSAHNIENSLRNWQQQYLITAPCDGQLVYLQNLSENQYAKSGDTLFAVQPRQEGFVAAVDIPVAGIGKARVGQKVILKLDDYPFQEFGTLEGQVVGMAPSLHRRTCRMEVVLPKGLESSYKRQFVCKSEMTGVAEIVTDDMSLLERAFFGIRKMVM